MQGGLFSFLIFRNFKLEIWFFRVGYGAIHLYQMKGYPCVFKFPEYGNLWFCDDPNHKGKCAMSKLQTYIPRGVIFDGVWIVIFPDIVYYIFRIYPLGKFSSFLTCFFAFHAFWIVIYLEICYYCLRIYTGGIPRGVPR